MSRMLWIHHLFVEHDIQIGNLYNGMLKFETSWTPSV